MNKNVLIKPGKEQGEEFKQAAVWTTSCQADDENMLTRKTLS